MYGNFSPLVLERNEFLDIMSLFTFYFNPDYIVYGIQWWASLVGADVTIVRDCGGELGYFGSLWSCGSSVDRLEVM